MSMAEVVTTFLQKNKSIVERIVLLYDLVSDILMQKKNRVKLQCVFLHGFLYVKELVKTNVPATAGFWIGILFLLALGF